MIYDKNPPKNPWIPYNSKLWIHDVGWLIIEACQLIMFNIPQIQYITVENKLTNMTK